MPTYDVDATLLAEEAGVARPVTVGPAGDIDGASLRTAVVHLSSILAQLDDASVDTVLSVLKATLTKLDTVGVSNFPASQSVTGPLTNTELRAIAVPVSASTLPLPLNAATATLQEARYGGGKTPVVATVTAAGDTTVHTPAMGKAVRLFWVSAINDPDEASTPIVKIKLGPVEVYRAFAVAHWEVFNGAVDAPLIVNLSGVASVAVTAHITEFTP